MYLRDDVTGPAHDDSVAHLHRLDHGVSTTEIGMRFSKAAREREPASKAKYLLRQLSDWPSRRTIGAWNLQRQPSPWFIRLLLGCEQ